uniref:Uncharacterized protein n=1 Tax=Romanomermis culicivorax TaxID=13658 RepID=A0A915IVN1_ROMCU
MSFLSSVVVVRSAVHYAACPALTTTTTTTIYYPRGLVSAVGSASALYSEGRGFEPLTERYFSDASATWIWAYDIDQIPDDKQSIRHNKHQKPNRHEPNEQSFYNFT